MEVILQKVWEKVPTVSVPYSLVFLELNVDVFHVGDT